MTAGGKATQPTTKNPSQHAIKRTAPKPSYAPLKIKSAKIKRDGNTLVVEWENDPAALPQFSYKVFYDGIELNAVSSIVPSTRRAELPIKQSGGATVHLICEDILGNKSKVYTLNLADGR
jgi:hypothetical protein